MATCDWRQGRRRRAWEPYQEGWTRTAIAKALGVTQGLVSQRLQGLKGAAPRPCAATRRQAPTQTHSGATGPVA